MSFIADKAALITMISARKCSDVKAIQAATYYPDLLTLLFQNASLFDCDLTYLESIFGIFPDTILIANGIFYNKTPGGVINNPKVMIKSSYDSIHINTGGQYGPIEIMDGSHISSIIISNNTQVESIGISGASVVGLLSVEEGSCVNVALVKACNSHNSTLSNIQMDSCVNNVGVDEGAIYNGYTCNTIST